MNDIRCEKLIDTKRGITTEYTKYEEIQIAINHIVQMYGKEIYKSEKKFFSLLTDYYPGNDAKKRLFKICLESGIAQNFITASNNSDSQKNVIIKRACSILEQQYFLKQNIAQEAILMITNSLGWEFEKSISDSHDTPKSEHSENTEFIETGQSDETIDYAQTGYNYYYGYGVPQDYRKAFDYYMKAAELGDARGQNGVAYCYYYGYGVEQDFYNAISWFKKAAEQNHSDSFSQLAFCHYYGYGCSRDYSKAFDYYMKAAELGDARGQSGLGFCYLYGYGCSKDYTKAFDCYMKAAELGDASGQNGLGLCYYYGYAVKKDLEKAKFYFQKAAANGNNDAKRTLERCF